MATQPHDPSNPSKPPKKVTQAQPPLEQSEGEQETPQFEPEAQIDLGLSGPGPGGGEPSGISTVAWSSLIEEEITPDSASEVRIDAPSDADMLVADASASGKGNDPVFDLDAPGKPSDSQVNVGADAPDMDLDALLRAAESDSEAAVGSAKDDIDLADLIQDAAPSSELIGQDEEEMIDLHVVETTEGNSSAIDLGSDAEMVVEEDARAGSDSDVVDLGDDVVVVEEASESDVIEVGEEMVVVEDASVSKIESGIMDLEVVDEEGSDVALGQEPRVYDTTSSGRDLIAEAVESGVDMQMPDRAEVAAQMKKDAGEEVSAVNLSPERTVETPLSATGVSAEVEELDLEFLTKIAESGASDSSSDVKEKMDDLPLEAVDPETDAIDLASIPDKVGDSAGSGIHSEEEVDLAALMAEHDGKSSGSRSTPDARTEQGIDLDEEALALHLAAREESEEVDLANKSGSGSGRGLRIEDLADDEEEALADEEAEADEMPVPVSREGEPEIEDEEAAEMEETVPPKARSRTGAWLGGTVLGTLVGAGACFALVFFGLIPGFGPQEKQAPNIRPNPLPQPQPMPQPAASALSAADYLKMGELAKAKEAGIEKMGTKPEELALRGRYRWEDYLAKQARSNAGVNLDDPAVKQAIDDLNKSNTADGLFALGQLQEMTNKLKEAEETYKQGAAKFQNDKRFQAGLLRLEATKESAPADRGAWRHDENRKGLPGRPLSAREEAMLAVLLIGLQAPNANQPANPPAAQAEPEEAGLPFWEALKLAREQKYKEALQKLDEARQLHDQRRKLLPRKPQNPTSDPNELIFLQACAELESYWKVREQLRDGGYLKNLADRGAPNQAVAALMKDLNDTRTSQANLGKKLVEEKIIQKPDDLNTGIEVLLTERKTANEKMTDLDKKLTTATKERDEVKGLQDDLAKELTTAKIIAKPEDLKKGVSDLVKEREKLLTEHRNDMDKIADLDKKLVAVQKQAAEEDQLLKEVQKDLFKAKYLTKEDDRAQLLPGVRTALEVAKRMDPKGDLQKLAKEKTDLESRLKQEQVESKQNLEKEKTRLVQEREKAVAEIKDTKDKELAAFKAESDKKTSSLEKQLQLRHSPAEMLGIWLPALDSADREQSLRAVADAGAVLDDPMASPTLKAQAKVIQGLAFRNVDKFAESKTVLNEAMPALPADAKEWRAAAQAGLKEVTDPSAYFAGRAEEWRNRGDLQQARTTLDRSIKVLGENNPGLLAERSLLLLERARSRSQDGRVAVGDPDLTQSLKDAEEVIKKTEGKEDQKKARALAYYARGRVYEELGDSAEAIDNYRSAIREHPGADAASSRYRVALARLLAQPRQGRPPLPPAPKEEEKKKEDSKLGLRDGTELDEQFRAALVVLLMVALQPPEMVQPGKAEALKLADDIIRQYEQDPRSVPFDVLAGAYMIKGQWTRALLIYAEGLKPHLRPDYYEGLMTILRNHPQIRRPESLAPPNPFEAESEYARGLRFYFSCDYGQAEKHFRSAIEYDNQDARYFYFLGLSKLMLGNVDAAEDFEQGARLEKLNKPASPAVSIALERVQGPARRILNEARLGIR